KESSLAKDKSTQYPNTTSSTETKHITAKLANIMCTSRNKKYQKNHIKNKITIKIEKTKKQKKQYNKKRKW
ncbi:hypothetical protein, partial [Salmonella enterica]|uniref:hypothetical protein n=1 Tax=Salmonella enterica TaxID=28901 RepID=UPI003F19FC12